MEFEDALDVATAQSMAALTLVEKLLLFMHGRDPDAMEVFLVSAMETAAPPPEHPDGETRQELLERTSVEIQQSLLSGVLAAQRRRAPSRREH